MILQTQVILHLFLAPILILELTETSQVLSLPPVNEIAKQKMQQNWKYYGSYKKYKSHLKNQFHKRKHVL